MNEYCEGIKVRPDDEKQIIHLEFYVLESTWSQKPKINLVSAITISYDLFKKFFVIKRACYKPMIKKVEEKEPKSQKELNYIQ